MKQLKKIDFTEIRSASQFTSYFSYKEPGLELCLEPCLNGFDVALYDDRQELLVTKVCTDIRKMPENMGEMMEFYDKVLMIASKMLHGWKTKKGKEQKYDI